MNPEMKTMKELQAQTLDLLTRLLEGDMLSHKGDELVQEFISTKLFQTPQPEEVEEWISCQTEMPKKTGEWYIGWSNKRRALPMFLDNTRDADNNIDGTIWLGIDGELGEDEEITHWRTELAPPNPNPAATGNAINQTERNINLNELNYDNEIQM